MVSVKRKYFLLGVVVSLTRMKRMKLSRWVLSSVYCANDLIR